MSSHGFVTKCKFSFSEIFDWLSVMIFEFFQVLKEDDCLVCVKDIVDAVNSCQVRLSGYRPHTTVKNARNIKSVSRAKLSIFERIFKL